MTRSGNGSAGAFVAGLTAAACAAVGFLAYQASAAADRTEQRPGKAAAAPSDPSPSAAARAAEKRERKLPARSGSGERVVYSLERDRVWLVGANEKVTRTFTVWPSSVDPRPGAYRVTSRSAHVTGSDGVPVENVVRFTTTGSTVIGFSAALDGSKPDPDPSKDTGGIRERPKDGDAMWLFATIGTKVVVTGSS